MLCAMGSALRGRESQRGLGVISKKKRLGPRPKPLHVSKNLARSELLAPFLFLG
jgi:hypothetical protein